MAVRCEIAKEEGGGSSEQHSGATYDDSNSKRDQKESNVDEKAVPESISIEREETIPGWTIMRPLRIRGKGVRGQKSSSSKKEATANVSTRRRTEHFPDDKNNEDLKVTATGSSDGRDEVGDVEELNDLRSDDELLGEDGVDAQQSAPMSEETRVNSGEGSVDSRSIGPQVEYKVYKRRWFGMLQLVLLNIIVSWDWLSFSANSSTCAQYYDVSPSLINWLSTAFLFAFVVASPVVIYTLHKGGPKPSIIISSILLLLGNWIRYGATRAGPHGSYAGVMVGQILTGLAQPFVLAAPTRYSDLWFTNNGRVAATAVMSLANPLGGALAQLIDPSWAGTPGQVPNMVLWVSIVSTVACVPSFFLTAKPPTPSSPSSVTPKTDLIPSLKYLFTNTEFYLVMIPFVFLVGLFNSISSIINQVLQPYSFTETEAGIAGGLLIVVGLVTAAITSPIVDKTKTYLFAIKIQVPIVGISYLAFTWAPQTRSVGAAYAILSIMGAASFSLVPIVLEYLIELTHPISPELTSTVCWTGGQLLGGVFILVSDALRAPGLNDGSADDHTRLPPGNMWRALVFQTVMAMIVVPLPLALGCCGRSRGLKMRRVDADKEAVERRDVEEGRVSVP